MKIKLKSGMSIYLLSVSFTQSVLVAGIGLTDHVNAFAIAQSKDEARALAESYYAEKGAFIDIMTADLTSNQNINSFMFPEKHIGFSEGIESNA